MLIGDLYVLLKFLTRYTFHCFAVPTNSMCWLIFFSFLQGSTLHLEFLANYICELSLLDYSLLCYLPSLVAASSVFLAKYILMPIKNPWVYVPNLIFLWIFIVKLDVCILHPQKINKPWCLHYLTFAFMLDQKQNSSLSYYTRYTPSELRGCVSVLHQLFRLGPGSNLPAIREKYSQHKVSLVYIMWLLMRIITLVPTLMLNALPSICSQYKFVAKKYCPPSIPNKFFQDLTS